MSDRGTHTLPSLRRAMNRQIPTTSFFFLKAKDGIRGVAVTGVQTCALPIFPGVLRGRGGEGGRAAGRDPQVPRADRLRALGAERLATLGPRRGRRPAGVHPARRRAVKIGKAACGGRGEISGGAGSLKKKTEK